MSTNLFDEFLCDDVFRIILSYLDQMEDLNQLLLVSKNGFRMGKLAMEDEFYSKYYCEKLTQITNQYHVNFVTNPWTIHLVRNPLFEQYLEVKHDFRKNLIEFTQHVNFIIEENYKEIKELKPFSPFQQHVYIPFEKIKQSISLSSTFQPNSSNTTTNNNRIILLVGEQNCGKTSLIHRLTCDEFLSDQQHSYLPMDVYNLENCLVSIQDTAGAKKYDRSRRVCYSGAQLCCMCFDVYSPNSLLEVYKRWTPEIVGSQILLNIPILLIGLKIDLRNNQQISREKRYKDFEKPITFEEGERIAKLIGAVSYLECSSLSGEGNIKDFAEIVEKSIHLFRGTAATTPSSVNSTSTASASGTYKMMDEYCCTSSRKKAIKNKSSSPNNNNNSNKLVVISGASSGIGAATAIEFAARGYKQLLLARRLDRLEQLINDTTNALSLDNTVIHQCDVTQIDQIKEGIEKAKKQFGISSVDCLINNAGVMLLQPFLGQSLSDQNQMFDTNVKGILNATNVVLKEMIDNKQGTIINISSIAGTQTFQTAAVYCGTKHAVHAISETLRSEVAGTQVRVVIVSPGFTESELLLGHNPKESSQGFEAMANSWELGMLKAKDISDAILYAYEAPKRVCIREIKLAPVEQSM